MYLTGWEQRRGLHDIAVFFSARLCPLFHPRPQLVPKLKRDAVGRALMESCSWFFNSVFQVWGLASNCDLKQISHLALKEPPSLRPCSLLQLQHWGAENRAGQAHSPLPTTPPLCPLPLPLCGPDPPWNRRAQTSGDETVDCMTVAKRTSMTLPCDPHVDQVGRAQVCFQMRSGRPRETGSCAQPHRWYLQSQRFTAPSHIPPRTEGTPVELQTTGQWPRVRPLISGCTDWEAQSGGRG